MILAIAVPADLSNRRARPKPGALRGRRRIWCEGESRGSLLPKWTFVAHPNSTRTLRQRRVSRRDAQVKGNPPGNQASSPPKTALPWPCRLRRRFRSARAIWMRLTSIKSHLKTPTRLSLTLYHYPAGAALRGFRIRLGGRSVEKDPDASRIASCIRRRHRVLMPDYVHGNRDADGWIRADGSCSGAVAGDSGTARPPGGPCRGRD